MRFSDFRNWTPEQINSAIKHAHKDGFEAGRIIGIKTSAKILSAASCEFVTASEMSENVHDKSALMIGSAALEASANSLLELMKRNSNDE